MELAVLAVGLAVLHRISSPVEGDVAMEGVKIKLTFPRRARGPIPMGSVEDTDDTPTSRGELLTEHMRHNKGSGEEPKSVQN